jgi:putative ABC transport system ATP-binding protein
MIETPTSEAEVIGVGLTKVFGTGETAVTALYEANIRLRRGEVVMLVGPSGSGKTTLLSILGCVLAPTQGHLQLFGETVEHASERRLAAVRRRKVGFVFQGHNLIGALSGVDNVALPLRLNGMPKAEALARAHALLDTVALGPREHALPEQLSGGERQRVAVARALSIEPPLVLADEPTASLDAENGRRVTELLTGLARDSDAAVLVVTHDERIFDLADRILHIEDGRIRETEAA